MKVSIITSCFNRERTIRDAIESVLGQDYPDVEYIVVDGDSKDGSLAIINEYKDRISKIISEPDKGMYEGINKGLRAATGDVVGLLHSDDVFYAADTISQIVKEFERSEAEMLYGNGIYVSEKDSQRVVRDWVSGPFYRSRVKRGWLPLHTSVFVKRSLMERCGLYNEGYRISADSDWLVRYLFENPTKVVYHNRYVVKMNMGGASTTAKQALRKWSEDMKMYRNHGMSSLTLIGKIGMKVPQFVGPWARRVLGL